MLTFHEGDAMDFPCYERLGDFLSGESSHVSLQHSSGKVVITRTIKKAIAMGKPCLGGGRKIYKWKIEGFSSLANLGVAAHRSGAFLAGGYNWELCLDISNDTDGKSNISLYVYLADAASLPSDVVVKANFRLKIHNRLYGKHIERKGTCNFQSTLSNAGFSHMISLDTFKDPLCGFLVNDSCIFSAEFMEIYARTLDSKGVFECWSLQKEKVCHVYQWNIVNFGEMRRPYGLSEIFDAGNLKWHLKLYPDGIGKNNHLSIFLELDDPIALPSNSKFYVDFTLCLLDQIDHNHKNLNAQHVFSSKDSFSGWRDFTSLEDFKSFGYLVNNSCIIKASINILASIKAQQMISS